MYQPIAGRLLAAQPNEQQEGLSLRGAAYTSACEEDGCRHLSEGRIDMANRSSLALASMAVVALFAAQAQAAVMAQ